MKELVSQGFRGQVLVAHHGKIVLDSAYGYADAGGSVAVTRETGFGLASVTKNFTAAAILKLREAGILQMSSKLGNLLPNVPADKQSITIEQLLSHTSGLGTTYAADGETDRAVAETKLLAQPLNFDPGTDFKYSDDGYVLLAAIIEEASGRSYEAFLAAELFKPAGMSHTYFWGTRDFGDPQQVAALQRELASNLTRPQWGQRGSGGVISTAADLHRWWKALREGRIVSKLAVDDLLRPRTVRPNGLGIGLGWFSSKTQGQTTSSWTRGNEDFGYNAILIAYPSEDCILAATSNVFLGEEPWTRVVQEKLEPLIVFKGTSTNSASRR